MSVNAAACDDGRIRCGDPASTAAVHRASKLSDGEATGITQTVRNYAASLGLAILGTLLVSEMRSHVTASLESMGVPHGRAVAEAARLAEGRSTDVATHGGSIPHFFELDFAYATRSVLWCMALVMAVAAVVGVVGLTRGRQELGDGVDWDGDTVEDVPAGPTGAGPTSEWGLNLAGPPRGPRGRPLLRCASMVTQPPPIPRSDSE